MSVEGSIASAVVVDAVLFLDVKRPAKSRSCLVTCASVPYVSVQVPELFFVLFPCAICHFL